MCADVRQLPRRAHRRPDSRSLTPSPTSSRVSSAAAASSTSAQAPQVDSGMLDAAEAGPTFNVDEGQVVGVLAGGTSAFEVPIENAEDDFHGGREAMRGLEIDERDCVVGISASGRTPYVLGAIEAAIAAGALTVGIACNVGTPLAHNVDRPIEVVVGPELIAGSTRMNSGTVQKIVLNVISTASMVRLGKTYGNLMVDLRPTNEKLRDRSARIVARITDASVEEAREALEAERMEDESRRRHDRGHVDASDGDASVSPSTKDAFDRRSTRIARRSPRRRADRDSPVGLVSGSRAPSSTAPWSTVDVAIHDGEIVAVGLSRPGRASPSLDSSTPKSTATPAWTS